jgi:type 1 glutamine amidotransferase
MNGRIVTATALLAAILLGLAKARAADEPAPAAGKVYGEWRIRVRPDKGTEYRKLIEEKGLPLFKAAGGRMVGWWNTAIGDLYEHLTIWEYDDMTAFAKAGQFLGKNKQFAEFVALRDPLLAGEDNRFLKLTPFAERPRLPESAELVIHEIHRVPLKRQEAYLGFMEKEGLALLKKHGFRPVGPWVVAVGRWSEITYLFRFDSLTERERLIAKFSAHVDAQTYGAKVGEFVEDVITRALIPTPFAAQSGRVPAPPVDSTVLPHVEQLAPGVYAAGFADRFGSANCGWVALDDSTLLVDLPRGAAVPAFLAQVARTTGKPARTLALTRFEPGDERLVDALLEHGIRRVLASPEIRKSLSGASGKTAERVEAVAAKTAVAGGAVPVQYLPLDQVITGGGAAVHVPKQEALFAGPFAYHGPRARLPGSDTAKWVATVRRLEHLGAKKVVPGFGSWAGPEVLTRQRRFLAELRRQVAYAIAQGRPASALPQNVRLVPDYLVWMPYDTPTADDLQHVYREMTVPVAPFSGHVPKATDGQPHALVLVGDQPHEPGHVEDGLRPVFEATGVVPHFTVDVKALTAENLAKVQLLVILRDGLQRPGTGEKSNYVWMTPEQEQAVVQFVENGGGFLNLHNSLGLYPEGGPYLKLAGGRYTGHGPLARFRVEVLDPDHPVTRGVQAFSVADEQHAPIHDKKVHLLLQSRADDGKTAAAGWVLEPGRGRLCHLAPGHTREALLQPMYQVLLRNAVNWCLRKG